MEELLRLKETSFTPKLQCLTHEKYKITKGCSDLNCQKKALLCDICYQEDPHREHFQSVQDFQTFLSNFSNKISKGLNENRKLLLGFISKKENFTLFKFLNDSSRHLEKVEANIQAQKVSIASDITQMHEIITVILQNVKDNLFQDLDKFYKSYKEQFSQTNILFHNNFNLAENFYYSNSSSLANKLSSLGNKANKFISEFKLSSYQNISAELDISCQKIYKMAVNPPTYQSDIKGLKNSLTDNIKQLFNLQLIIPNYDSEHRLEFKYPKNDDEEPAVSQNIQAFGSNAIISDITSIPGQGDWITLKPYKKYTVDIKVSSIISLSPSIFIMTTEDDGLIRVFDLQLKKLRHEQAHDSQVSLLEKLDLSANNRQSFLSGGNDGKIIAWEANTDTGSVRQLKQYYFGQTQIQAGIDMKNGGGFLFLTTSGQLGYCNITTNQEFYVLYFNFYHKKPLSSRLAGKPGRLLLLEPGISFISYTIGQESGMVWKLKENLGKIDAYSCLDCSLASASQIINYPGQSNFVLLVQQSSIIPYNLDSKIKKVESKGGPEVEILTLEVCSGQKY